MQGGTLLIMAEECSDTSGPGHVPGGRDMYDKSKFRVRKRKRSTRGVWVLLEHLQSGKEIWVGSLHLPVNEVVEEIDRFTAEFMACLPATDKPAILLGDMNTHFTWGVQQGVAEPRSMRSRWSKLRQATVERGFVQIAPRGEDAQAPTFVPRRAGASSAQIDGVFAARCHVTPVHVEKDSRHEIGTDHERVKAWLLLSGVRRGTGCKAPGRGAQQGLLRTASARGYQ